MKMELAADLILSQPARKKQNERDHKTSANDHVRAGPEKEDFTSSLGGLLCRGGSL